MSNPIFVSAYKNNFIRLLFLDKNIKDLLFFFHIILFLNDLFPISNRKSLFLYFQFCLEYELLSYSMWLNKGNLFFLENISLRRFIYPAHLKKIYFSSKLSQIPLLTKMIWSWFISSNFISFLCYFNYKKIATLRFN